jgi:hypothetical protein
MAAVIFFLLATLPPQPARTNLTVKSRADAANGQRRVSTSTPRDRMARLTRMRLLLQHRARVSHSSSSLITATGCGRHDPPAYLHGVLCLDAVEISTNGGHYVALDMRPAPYPLGGEPSAVVEDVRRLGGFGIVAHPDSPRSQLAWKDWDAPFDGIEWLSADSEWRDESRVRISQVLLDYLVRPAPALAVAARSSDCDVRALG